MDKLLIMGMKDVKFNCFYSDGICSKCKDEDAVVLRLKNNIFIRMFWNSFY